MLSSPYKWYGPHAGALVVRHNLLREIEPYRVRPADYDGPARWETGTPQIELLAGIAAAAEFMLDSGVADVSRRETHLLELLQSGLSEVPGVTVRGPGVTPDRAPTVVFTVAGRSPSEVDAFLASRRIAVWHGDNYATELVDALGLRESGGLVRAGIVRYTTEDDIAALLAALTDLAGQG